MKTDFVPRRDSDLDSFEGNFKSKLQLHAQELELDAAEVTEVAAIIDAHRDIYAQMVSKRADAKATAEQYKLGKSSTIKELRRISKKIKALKKYTTSFGEDLKIIGPEFPEIIAADKKPVIKLKVNGHIVDIRVIKGTSNAVNIYSRRGSETDFKFLAINSEVHYMDIRDNLEPGKPEQREYYAFYVEKNIEIGNVSDIVKILVP